MNQSMCDCCAFNRSNKGGANGEAYNRLRSEVAALTGVPFYCHSNIDWKGDKMFKIGGKLVRIKGNGEAVRHQPIVCAGWQREVQKYIPAGSRFAEARRRLGRLGNSALALIESFAEEKDQPLKDVVLIRMERTIKKIRRYGRMLRKAAA